MEDCHRTISFTKRLSVVVDEEAPSSKTDVEQQLENLDTPEFMNFSTSPRKYKCDTDILQIGDISLSIFLMSKQRVK